MRSLLCAVLVLVSILASSQARAADRSPSLVVRTTYDHPDYARTIVLTLIPDARTGGVTVRLQVNRSTQEKTFDKDLRAELARRWGSPTFSLAKVPSETDCLGQGERWEVERGAEHRQLCRNKAAIHRLSDFRQAVEAMMRE